MVSGRKAGRQGLARLPSEDLSCAGMSAGRGPAGPVGQLPAWSPGGGGGDATSSLGNCWDCFSPTRVPSLWLTPASHSLPAPVPLPPSRLQPSLASAPPLSSQSPSPTGAQGGWSVPSRHVWGPALPACSKSVGVTGRPLATLLEPVPGALTPELGTWTLESARKQPPLHPPCWCVWEGHPRWPGWARHVRASP